ncbi:MAG: hypothetical protein U0Y68_14420 [Blastocatellia bacterium]
MREFSSFLLAAPTAFEQHFAQLPPLSYVALDVETANWWKPQEEQIALLQLAYRRPADEIEVALLDVAALPSLAPVQALLEAPNIPVAIHNASFDALKLAQHCGIRTRAIHDTMRAARRAGAKRYSLAAQVKEHFGTELDKGEQQSDWGRRPFTASQLRYAANDAAYTLLLYERQRELGLSGVYELPLRDDLPLLAEAEVAVPINAPPIIATEENLLGLAALGLVVKKPHYYSPTSLLVAIGQERSGLADWIVRGLLGDAAEVEDGEAQLAITNFLLRGLLVLDAYRRCAASPAGAALWQATKPSHLP